MSNIGRIAVCRNGILGVVTSYSRLLHIAKGHRFFEPSKQWSSTDPRFISDSEVKFLVSCTKTKEEKLPISLRDTNWYDHLKT